MSDKQTSGSRKAESDSTKAAEASRKELQSAFDEANEKGYFGTVPDPTPNENYTVAGVTSGKPTPETTRRERRENAIAARRAKA